MRSLPFSSDIAVADTTWPRQPAWAIVEIACGVAIMGAGLAGLTPVSSTPFLLGLAALGLWMRGPGWRALGLSRMPSSRASRVVALGAVVGVLYQFVGTYLIEPVLARMTSGQLPDVSALQLMVGNERQLLFWLTMSWTLAAFMEEMVFRGWLMARLAELGRYSTWAWFAAAVVSSMLFGAVHLYQGVSGVLATGLTGAVFAAVYFATGRNLWAAIIAHGTLDTVGFMMIYLGVYPGV